MEYATATEVLCRHFKGILRWMEGANFGSNVGVSELMAVDVLAYVVTMVESKLHFSRLSIQQGFPDIHHSVGVY